MLLARLLNQALAFHLTFTPARITDATFTVHHFALPQPAEYVSEQHHLGTDGMLHFPCGRVGSTFVDQWWYARTGDNTTGLACAFLGTLSLRFPDGEWVTLDRVTVAHGKGWMINGPVCVAGAQIECPGINSEETGRVVAFRSGAAIQIDSRTTMAWKRMRYQDNVLIISSSGLQQKIYSATFIVADYNVANDQDPKQHIYAGLVVETDLNNQLHFPIGRHRMSSVAEWWSARFNRDQSTFDHQPGALNYAMIGDLKIRVPGRQFLLRNIGLAQGRNFLFNNWWLAGQSCKYAGAINEGDHKQQLQCLAEDEAGAVWTLTFWRGGPGHLDNDVRLMNASPSALVVPDPPKPALLAHKNVTWGKNGPTLG